MPLAVWRMAALNHSSPVACPYFRSLMQHNALVVKDASFRLPIDSESD